MKTKSTISQMMGSAAVLASAIGLVLLTSSCASGTKVSSTVLFPGNGGAVARDQVRLSKWGEQVDQPYQIIGKVTLSRVGKKIPEERDQRLKEAAAKMGANAVVSVNDNEDGERTGIYRRSGIAVKLLAPGASPEPLKTEFIVALLPVAPGEASAKEAEHITKGVPTSIAFCLEVGKGYFLMPGPPVAFQGGLAKVRGLNDVELATLGGKDAQLLMEVEFVGRSHSNVIIASSESSRVRMTLFSKAKREVVWQNEAEGKFTSGIATGVGVLPDMVPGAKREFAMSAAMVKVLRTLPALPHN